MSAPLQLNYPVTPVRVIQPFGGNPQYYARFLDAFGHPEKGHMGIDLMASHGQPVYAPCDGDAFYTSDSHGGDGIYIRTPNNGAPAYEVILWHLCSKDDPQFKPLIPCDGSITRVTRGQHIAFADNTGAPFESSGDHLHIGLIPTGPTGAPLHPDNGFGGCIDPAPFLIEPPAQVASVVQAISTITPQVAASNLPTQTKIDFYKKVAQFLTTLLNVLQLE